MMLAIQFLTIHCAATPEGRDVKAATVEQWDIARFGQKSYHHIIELDGHVHRSLEDNVRGAHTGGHNTGNIGICYVGGCDAKMHGKDTRTEAQKAALDGLIRDYVAKYPAIIIRGHREWPGVAKECPSFSVRDHLKAMGLGDHAR